MPNIEPKQLSEERLKEIYESNEYILTISTMLELLSHIAWQEQQANLNKDLYEAVRLGNRYLDKVCEELESQLSTAKKDSERLDWLDKNRKTVSCYRINGVSWYVSGDNNQEHHSKVRSAIDSAIAQEKGKQ